MPGRYTGSSDYKYGFNGHESDGEVYGSKGSSYDFGARMYDSRIGRFNSSDPWEDKYPWQSSYAYFANSPISTIDWKGFGDSPIYDNDGEFLGTDDEGLQGERIIMDKKDFVQGMSHNDAVTKGIDLGNISQKDFKKIIRNGVWRKTYLHNLGLKDRPDYDGVLTREEGIQFALEHPNSRADDEYTPDNMVYIDAAKLDFGNLSVDNFKIVGDKEPQNLLNIGNLLNSLDNKELENTINALGRVYMVLNDKETGNVSIFNDYNQTDDRATDFDWNTGGNWVRSKLINREREKFGLDDSHGFRAYFYGTGTVKKSVPKSGQYGSFGW